jgi:hypothetical protein
LCCSLISELQDFDTSALLILNTKNTHSRDIQKIKDHLPIAHAHFIRIWCGFEICHLWQAGKVTKVVISIYIKGRILVTDDLIYKAKEEGGRFYIQICLWNGNYCCFFLRGRLTFDESGGNVRIIWLYRSQSHMTVKNTMLKIILSECIHNKTHYKWFESLLLSRKQKAETTKLYTLLFRIRVFSQTW